MGCTGFEIALIKLLADMSFGVGICLGIFIMIIVYCITTIFQQKRILKILKSKEDRDILSAFWLTKKGKK